jgi:hypothetical protein
MNTKLRRFYNITKSFNNNYYNNLGKVEIIIDNDDELSLDFIKFMVIPFEGIHKNVKYIVTLKYKEDNKWPLVFVDSDIFDKIKTKQYLKNKGKVGDHKGICIKNLSYGYCFNKNFKYYCNNRWENYIYYIITVFNNFQDFEKGNGIKSNYKNILNII